MWGTGFSNNQVSDEVKKIDVKKSSGFSEINAKCLKICLMNCVSEFTHILNICLQKSWFPITWKIAIMVPILKQGNPKNIDNLRPISHYSHYWENI